MLSESWIEVILEVAPKLSLWDPCMIRHELNVSVSLQMLLSLT